MARRTKEERQRAVAAETSIVDQIYRAYEGCADDWRRDHLGASLVGHTCDRYLWLNFRWAANPEHTGKLLRLFETGDFQEPRIVNDLRLTGMRVWPLDSTTGDQWRVRWGHLGGSADGIVCDVPGFDPEERFLLEVKTANRKSFDYLKKKKVRSAKREHFVQMQLYMAGLGLSQALYVAVCKDTDEIYVQIVDFDEELAERHLGRAQKIIDATEPPPRLDQDYPPCVLVSKDGTRWPCQYFDLCHGKQKPERNCRTCVDSTPFIGVGGEPQWGCGIDPTDQPETLTPHAQRVGCDQHCSIPPIVNADVAQVEGRRVTYQFDDGDTWTEDELEA